jgi:hypothetical protein
MLRMRQLFKSQSDNTWVLLKTCIISLLQPFAQAALPVKSAINTQITHYPTTFYTGLTKGYIVKEFVFEKLFYDGVQIITKIKKNMRNVSTGVYDKIMLRKRSVIECVIGSFNNKY